MKNIAYISIAIVMLFVGYRLLASPGSDIELQGENIICFGDSLTYGTGADPDMNYPSQLSKMIDRPIINAGIPGDTTARALQRLDKDVLAKSPRIVIITLGGNDLKNGVNKKTAFSNLRQIIEAIQGKSALVVVGGIKFTLVDKGYGKAYKELCAETGALLVPDILDGLMGKEELMSDPIHPNAAGYTIMAQRFSKAIKPYL